MSHSNIDGKFLTIEGQDGAGKSTNVEVVKAILSERGIPFVHTREPGGTAFGERVRELLLKSTDTDFGDLSELLLIFAARAQHIEQVILPNLAAGNWVLCDRFTDCTYAYQGGGRGMANADIKALENLVQKDCQPDLTLLLDLPVELGEQRATARADTADRFELQQSQFKQRVRDSYLGIAQRDPHRVKVIDASQSLDGVANTIRSVLTHYIDSALGVENLGR